MPSPDVQHLAEIATPHDLLLTGSALGVASGMMPDTSWARFGLNLARRPGVIAERVGSFGRELASIATGTSDRAPAKPDKRFSDPAWPGNPLTSPLGWKAIIDTGGLSIARGLRRFLHDMAVPPRIPSMVEPDAFTVGEDLAVTPGAVVYRNEVFELIQYTPQTEKVWAVPLLMVPPVINKFYILDIAPGRSMVEYLLSQGHQVFAISWRNPTAAQRSWDCDTYGGAIVDALDAIQKATGSQSAHVQASCSGGILAAMTVAHLSAMGEADRIASLTLMVTVLDQGREGLAAAVDETTAKLAIAFSARKGYLDGRALAEVFAWLRPTDLVWRYWVNNYLQGRSPAPFDVLFWNSDTTRMPAGLHRDMLLMGKHNALAEPGGVRMLGTLVDLGTVTADTYVVAGISDHISPWHACYRSARMLGSKDLQFILSSSGHIAALVNPRGKPKASYRAGTADERDPKRWMASAESHGDSWWPDFSAWLAQRGGEQKPPPTVLGGNGLAALGPAPGSYVHER